MPFPDLSGDMPLLPARMVNEYEYCPRLAYLEWVQGEWADSGDTVEGRHAHRRVDRPGGRLPESGGDPDERLHARSITLSSNRLSERCSRVASSRNPPKRLRGGSMPLLSAVGTSALPAQAVAAGQGRGGCQVFAALAPGLTQDLPPYRTRAPRGSRSASDHRPQHTKRAPYVRVGRELRRRGMRLPAPAVMPTGAVRSGTGLDLISHLYRQRAFSEKTSGPGPRATDGLAPSTPCRSPGAPHRFR